MNAPARISALSASSRSRTRVENQGRSRFCHAPRRSIRCVLCHLSVRRCRAKPSPPLSQHLHPDVQTLTVFVHYLYAASGDVSRKRQMIWGTDITASQNRLFRRRLLGQLHGYAGNRTVGPSMSEKSSSKYPRSRLVVSVTACTPKRGLAIGRRAVGGDLPLRRRSGVTTRVCYIAPRRAVIRTCSFATHLLPVRTHRNGKTACMKQAAPAIIMRNPKSHAARKCWTYVSPMELGCCVKRRDSFMI
jgi:hypothetical protein